jgi:hypothetical protein
MRPWLGRQKEEDR